MSSVVFLLPVMALLLVIPVCIGVYVYRDANRRGMNGVLWTLIALLTPSLIGFIIYLIVRSSYSDLHCPRCDRPVTEQYVVCPNCENRLRAACSDCGTPVERGWKVCPHCAKPLPEEFLDITPPVRKKDRTLGKILILIIAVPVLLVVCALFMYSAAGKGGATSTSIAPYEADEFLKAMDDEEISEWLASIGNEYDTAYVLRYQAEHDPKTCYVVYAPCVGLNAEVGIGVPYSLFGERVRLDFNTSGQAGNAIYQVNLFSGNDSGDKIKLQVYCNDKKLKMEIKDINFIPVIPEEG